MFSSIIKISFRNLSSSKLRSFLTILGVVIGVSSVIIIFSIGQSAQALILGQLKGVGSNLIGVLPVAADEKGPPASVMGISVTTLKYEDLLELTNRSRNPYIEKGAGYVLGTTSVSFGSESLNASFTGTTHQYLEVENAELKAGRFFTKEEEANLSRVAVLGSTIAQDIFGQENPINKKIKIGEHKFTVIGVFQERGSVAFGLSSQDESVFVPLFTAQKLLLGINHLGFIRLKVVNENLIPQAIAQSKEILRQRHRLESSEEDDFTIRSLSMALNVLENVTDVLRYFLLVIGSISLVVGGVGIMNIMLISVSQRIREIGVRKAVGAKNSDLLLQFIFESTVISLLGGVVGIIIGIGISFLAAKIISGLGYDWEFLISIWSIFWALLVSFLIGMVFGIYPARKASKISPMESLRYE